MTTEKEQLEAEIAKRDARIEELIGARDHLRLQASMQAQEARTQKAIVAEIGAMVGEPCDWLTASAVHEALKAQQPSAGVVLPERMPRSSDLYAIAQHNAGWNSALDEVARRNPCRAQSVPDDLRAAAENCSFVMRYIGSMEPDEIDGDNVELRFEDEDGRDTGADASIVEYAEKVADLLDAMLAAAPSAKKESGDE